MMILLVIITTETTLAVLEGEEKRSSMESPSIESKLVWLMDSSSSMRITSNFTRGLFSLEES